MATIVLKLQEERELNFIANKNFKSLEPFVKDNKQSVKNSLSALEEKQ